MKIAIVHDYIKEYGGAERVLERLIKLFPQADVYTSIYAPEFLGPHAERFKNYEVKTTWLNRIPKKHRLLSPLRVLSPLAFKSLDLKSYDVVIVSQTGAYFPNFIKKNKKQRVICYTHTPPRYLYGYRTAREIPKNSLFKIGSMIAFNVLRIVDFEASKNVDTFIANSREVESRIKKFYRRDAMVIYPPVAIPNVIEDKKHGYKTKDYYVAGGRLARAKGMDVIVSAFVKNGKLLKIFGRGFAGYEEELKAKARSQKVHIEFLGEIDDVKKFELIAGAKAYIFASYDEDFGITPVEAMGVGIPVIAYKSGGVKETVIDGKTGVFYEPNNADSLNLAIEKLEKTKINPTNCLIQAEKFSEKEFDKKMKEVVLNA